MAKGKGKTGDHVATNRRASFDFELGDKYEAGMSLIGSEVRSLRVNGADVSTAWVEINHRGEAWVKEMRIPVLLAALASGGRSGAR